MALVKVIDAVDGNTLMVTPCWKVGPLSGNLVRVHGMKAPAMTTEEGQLARCKMGLMLAGSAVSITRTYAPEGVVLPCDVEFRGVPMWMHFPEYTADRPRGAMQRSEPPDIAIEMNTPQSF